MPLWLIHAVHISSLIEVWCAKRTKKFLTHKITIKFRDFSRFSFGKKPKSTFLGTVRTVGREPVLQNRNRTMPEPGNPVPCSTLMKSNIVCTGFRKVKDGMVDLAIKYFIEKSFKINRNNNVNFFKSY